MQTQRHIMSDTDAHTPDPDVEIHLADHNEADVRDVRELIEVIEARKSFGIQSRKSGSAYASFTEWHRSQEATFPLRFFRCQLCDEIKTGHIGEHMREVHKLDAQSNSYEIKYNPQWSGSCEFCDETFTGPRVEAWKELQRHTWYKHISDGSRGQLSDLGAYMKNSSSVVGFAGRSRDDTSNSMRLV